jgi:hypothetical protein
VTVTAERYKDMKTTFLTTRLQLLQGHEHIWFHQDGDTDCSHSENFRDCFAGCLRNDTFPVTVMRPGLLAHQTSQWGYLNSKVLGRRAAKLNEPKTRIRDETGNITEDLRQEVMRSFFIRVHQCIQRNGAHLTDLIFKK